MRVAIVGAGAAGLCCARHLSKLLKSFEIRVFEQSQSVGGTWVYSDDHVHSSIYKSLRYVRNRMYVFMTVLCCLYLSIL